MNKIIPHSILFASLIFFYSVFLPRAGLAECSADYNQAFINEFNTKSGNVEVYFTDSANHIDYTIEVCREDKHAGLICESQTLEFDGSDHWLFTSFDTIVNNDNFDIALYDNTGNIVDYLVVYIGKSEPAYFNDDYINCTDISDNIDSHTIHKQNNGQRQFYRIPDGGGEWIETNHNKNKTYGETNSGSQTQIHHFRLDHPSTALTCRSAVITVRACLNAECSELYANDIQINLSPEGWLGGAVQPLGGASVGTYRFRHTEATSVNVGVTSQDVLTQNGTLCYSDGSLSDCSIGFLDSGFVVSVDNGHSCTDLSGTIQAVQKDDKTNLCVGDDSFAGTSRDVGFWFNYVNPSSGSLKPYLNSTELGQTQTTSTTALGFDANAEAGFTLSYPDAGQLVLHALFSGSGQDEGLIMEGESAPFTLAPHHFELSSPLNNSDSNGTPIGVAGAPFNATISAVCEDGSITPNFSAPTTLSAQTPFEPAGGTLGVLSNSDITADMFAGGIAEPDNLNYSEVGNFTLQAESTDYLDSGMDISGSSVVGRFVPARLIITDNTPEFAASCTGFTYQDQPFYFAGGKAPELSITAISADGNIALNYGNDFWKLATTLSGRTYTDEGDSAATLEVYLDSADATLSGAADYDGVGFLTLQEGTDGDEFTYERQTPEAPFDADIKVAIPAGEITDEDGVCYDHDDDGNCDAYVINPITGTELIFGRIRLENAHGSELLPLNLPFYAEYFDGNAFVTNDLDNCSTFDLSNFEFTHDTGSNGDPVLTQQITGGKGILTWGSTPLTPGSIDIELDLSISGSDTPWLQYDWDGDGTFDENPSARATFGIFKGNEHIIYLRETTWR